MRLFLASFCAALCACAITAAPAAPASGCGPHDYAYAGLAASSPARGVFAVLRATRAPRVSGGHVAGWIGVGGEGYGPGGSTVWLQAGISAFPNGTMELYYELALPGQKARYTRVRSIAPGEAVRLSVASNPSLPGWWEVRANGVAVSDLVHLPGSEGGWEPVATAETWDGGVRACNSFSYRFDSLRVTQKRAEWETFRGSVWQDPGYRVKRGGSGFTATTA